MDERDTIVAIATPPGEGALAVVRMSGPGALEIAARVFRPRRRDAPGSPAAIFRSHRARLGLVVDAAGRALDEALLLPMLAPRSLTGQDTVEFFCHGGRLPARLVCEACLAAGARPAGPGEFSRRAFLSGRLSLDQAEAVADLIAAEEELAAGAALAQLRGGLRDEIAQLEAPLLGLLAELEGSLEFADEDEGPGCGGGGDDGEPLAARTARLLAEGVARIDALLAHAGSARRLRDGVQVVLAGPPNAGKSMLFNALLGEPRALVDHEPGTTRDVVSGRLSLGGCLFELHDTAGLRPAAGRVELLGMERTAAAIAAADIVLELAPLAAAAAQGGAAPAASAAAPRQDAAVIAVLTKSDLAPQAARAAGEAGYRGGAAPVITSALTREGLEELKGRLLQAAEHGRMLETARLGLLLNQRHRARLAECRQTLAELAELARPRSGGTGPGLAGEEVIASLLSAALARLGELSGRIYTEQLLGEVFARFCVGK